MTIEKLVTKVIIIGNNAIGANCSIVAGVKIGNNVTIGAAVQLEIIFHQIQ